MDYVKDEFGNIIGYKGDDLSQQQAKLSGIPQGQVPAQGQQVQVAQPEAVPTVKNNLFAKPQQNFTIPGLTPDQVASMTYTDKELEAGHQLVGERAKVQPQAVGLAEHGGIAGQNGQATRYNPQPRPQITNMDELASAMGYTSPEEEARLRKASVNNQRILAVADALRHIGNIANTVNYAPAQRFNQPWAEQQARYEHGKAQRDAANARYLSYQRQKADQERAERKLDAQIKKQDKDAERAERMNEAKIARIQQQNAKDEAWSKYYGVLAHNLEEGWPLEKAKKEAEIALKKEQTRLTSIKADNGGKLPSSGGSGGSRRRGGKARAGQGGGKYWIDVPGENGNTQRIYYPNKTMWQQGIEQYSDGSDRYQEVEKGKDALGRPQMQKVKTPYEQRSKNIREGKTYVRRGGNGKGKKKVNW